MRIVVASGKGGTGKTLVATSLALVAAEQGSAALLDCDVEAPNAGLFLKPRLNGRLEVAIPIPQVDESLCTHCGRCGEVCQYHALAVLPQKVLVFADLCHGCGSCALVCPTQAIIEVSHRIGVIESGQATGIAFVQGTLDVGQAMATPVIRRLKSYSREAGLSASEVIVLDAPPGTACPVIETLRGADVALLVTEPTPFGLHDLQLAVGVARDALRLPVGVVINKVGIGDEGVESYCQQENIPVVLRIPLDRRIAAAYSEGNPLVYALPEYREPFVSLLTKIRDLAQQRVL